MDFSDRWTRWSFLFVCSLQVAGRQTSLMVAVGNRATCSLKVVANRVDVKLFPQFLGVFLSLLVCLYLVVSGNDDELTSTFWPVASILTTR